MNESKKISLAESNRAKTTLKVEEALTYLKKRKLPITIKSVTEQAGISRKTLYNRPDLKLMVEEAISLQNDLNHITSVKRKLKGSVQTERLEKLREKNKQLLEDKKLILEQNMVLTKENSSLKRRLYYLEELLQSNRNLHVLNLNKSKE